MCTITHLAVGGALGGCVKQGGLAFLLGVGSHAVLDAVPHYDVEDFRVDLLLTAAGIAGLLGFGYWCTPVFWGAVGAVVPDLEVLIWRLGLINEKRMIFPSHNRLIRHGARLSVGASVHQVLLILGAVGCLVILRSQP
jgi:hypothetical protein